MVESGDASSSSLKPPPSLEVVCGVFLEELSLALGDDCHESPSEREELVRVTLDGVSVSLRPEFQFTKTLRSLGGQVPRFSHVTLCVANVQVDNQMFNKHPFEFPLLLVGRKDDQETGEAGREGSELADKRNRDHQRLLNLLF